MAVLVVLNSPEGCLLAGEVRAVEFFLVKSDLISDLIKQCHFRLITEIKLVSECSNYLSWVIASKHPDLLNV